MSIIWLPSVKVSPWVRTFGRSKAWKMKHWHIVIDARNNMNVYAHWHRSSELPMRLFLTVFRHATDLAHFQLSSSVACRGSHHTLDHSLLHFVSVLIQCHSFCRRIPKQQLSRELQWYTATTTSSTSWISCTHSSDSPLLLHKAWWVFTLLTSLKNSLRLRPQRQSLRALYSLYRFIHVANALFQCQSSAPKRLGSAAEGQGVKHSRSGGHICYSVLQEKKIFCCCYFS